MEREQQEGKKTEEAIRREKERTMPPTKKARFLSRKTRQTLQDVLGLKKADKNRCPLRSEEEKKQLRVLLKSYRVVALDDPTQVFFHGTESKFGEDEIEGPAWFAGRISHAISYMERGNGTPTKGDNVSYLYEYKSKRKLILLDLRFTSYEECMKPLKKMPLKIIRRSYAFTEDMESLEDVRTSHKELMDFAKHVEKPIAHDLFNYQANIEGVEQCSVELFSNLFVKFEHELKALGIDGWISNDEGTEVMLLDPCDCLKLVAVNEARTEQDYRELTSRDKLPGPWGFSMLKESLEEFYVDPFQDILLSFQHKLHNSRVLNQLMTPEDLEDAIDKERERRYLGI